MKKTLRMILATVLVLSLVLCLAACGDKGVDISGKYTLVSMEAEGMTVEGEMLESILGEMDMYVKLNRDGTGEMSVMGETAEMEYKNGKIWPVEEPDEKVDFTVEDGKLTLEVEGAKMVFQK